MQGLYRNMKTKFQDNSRFFSVFKDSISLTFRQFLIVFAGKGDSEIGRSSFLSPEYFIMVLINTGTTGKLNRSTMRPRSSTNPAIFTLFSFTHRINPIEWKRISVFYYFQGQFHIFKGNLTKFQDKWHYFEIPGVVQDQGQIQGLFQVCANTVMCTHIAFYEELTKIHLSMIIKYYLMHNLSVLLDFVRHKILRKIPEYWNTKQLCSKHCKTQTKDSIGSACKRHRWNSKK